VYNRRLFKPRPARAKLNQMGGIMASSVPLMQSVQKFANGTSVRIPQDTRASNIYRNVSPLNLITSIQDFLNTGSAQSGIGAIQDQNKMIRAGITEDDLARVRANVSPEDVRRVKGLQALVGDDEAVASTPVPKREVKPDPTAASNIYRNVSFGGMVDDLKDFLTTSVSEGRPADAGSGIGAIQDQNKAVAQARQAERDAEDFLALERRQERERQIGQSTNPAATGDMVEEQNEQAKADFLALERKEELKRRRVNKNAVERLIKKSLQDAEAIEGDDDATLTSKGTQVVETGKDLFNNVNISPQDKNETLLELLGEKPVGKKLSKKEQILKNKKFYKELFGKDAKEEETIDGFNLAMMGFLIASGDSPNALKNIARGAAAGIQNFKDTEDRRAKDEKELVSFAIADYEATKKSDQAAKEFRLDYNLKVTKLNNEANRAKTKAKQDRYNSILSSLAKDPALAVAFSSFSEDEIEKPNFFKKLMNRRAETVKQNPDLSAASDMFRKSRSQADVDENRRGKRLDAINRSIDTYRGITSGRERKKVNKEIGTALNKYVEGYEPTTQDLIDFYAREQERLEGTVDEKKTEQSEPEVTTETQGTQTQSALKVVKTLSADQIDPQQFSPGTYERGNQILIVNEDGTGVIQQKAEEQ